MWYFAWLLGMPLAAGVAILNGMWYELREEDDRRRPPVLHPGPK